MIDKIARWIATHPKIVVVICLLLLIPSAVGYFSTFINYDILSYLPADIDSVKGEVILDETFHNAASSIIIVEDTEKKDVAELKEKISQVDGVSSAIWIDSLMDITIPEDMLPDDIKNIFFSEEGNSTLMMVQYLNDGSSQETMDAIGEIRSLMNKNCFMSGLSAISTDTKELADSQAPIYIALAIVLALIVLSFTMSSWILPFILLAALCVAVVYNMGTNVFLGQISYITQCIAAILQLGVTMDYSVFLIDRYNEELTKNPNHTDAMAEAIKGTFTSLCGSSLTTIFGFVSLCFMTFTLGMDIGVVMAKGVLLGVLTVVIFLPSLILLLEKPIKKTPHRSFIPKFDKINEFTLKHRRALAIVFVLLFIPAILAQSHVDVYYNMDLALPQDLPSIVGLNKMRDDFNMSSAHFLIVDENLPAGDMTDMTQELKTIEGITSVLSINSFVGPSIPNDIIPQEIKDICIKDGKQLMMLNSSYGAATDEGNAQVDEVVSTLKKYDPNGYATGEAVLTKDLVDITDRDFKVTSIISIAAIFVLVAIIFRSVSVPVILVSSIELAILINKACAVLMGTTIPFIAPTVIGCVQLGATVDYAILLTTRFREELRSGKPRRDALLKAANESDRSIFQSALVFFAATFGVYLVCDIELIKSICSMLARGSIISALIIILLVTPILLVSEGVINKTTFKWRKNQ